MRIDSDFITAENFDQACLKAKTLFESRGDDMDSIAAVIELGTFTSMENP